MIPEYTIRKRENENEKKNGFNDTLVKENYTDTYIGLYKSLVFKIFIY